MDTGEEAKFPKMDRDIWKERGQTGIVLLEVVRGKAAEKRTKKTTGGEIGNVAEDGHGGDSCDAIGKIEATERS